MNRKILGSIATTALAVGAFVVAFASPVSAQNQVYSACAQGGSIIAGTLTVGVRTSCPQGIMVQWNEQGSIGPTGPAGPAGSAGPACTAMKHSRE